MGLSWFAILRLGLVQAAIGAVVVLTTSTFNRLMVVELGLPAALPALLVAFHYAVQISRPAWGHRSDRTGTRTRYILAGMVALAAGAVLAAAAIGLGRHALAAGIGLSVLAYGLIGLGAGAAGTSLLALLAAATAPRRRAAAASLTWLMMILGIAGTAATVGHLLDPFSPARLLRIAGAVGLIALVVTVMATAGIERACPPATGRAPRSRLRDALAEAWADPRARRFTLFVFLSMVAYFLQDMIMEPFAGLVFGYTPGQSTSLAGAQHGGVFLGMLTVGVASTGLGLGSMRSWVAAGCLGSAAALCAIAALGLSGGGALLVPAAMALGLFNGMFAVAAIGAMMTLAGEGGGGREGTRMGLWGAAQAIAAAVGGVTGATAADLLRLWWPAPSAFATVFLAEAALFVLAAGLALHLVEARPSTRTALPIAGE